MRTAIPVREHGSPTTATQNGAFRAGESGKKELVFDIPADADLRKTRISLSVSPTPASTAFEAIPFLAGYPYGCVEQTMSRFYPTILAAKTLKQLGIDITRLVERSRPKRPWPGGSPSPEQFLDAAELDRMIEAGLQRLQRFQHEDGGWGWWEHDSSSPFMTAYVLTGLHVAAEAGAPVDQYEFDRGLSYLAKLEAHSWEPANYLDPAGVQHTAMFVTYALALRRPASFRSQDWSSRNDIDKALGQRLDPMFRQRNQLSLYDRVLLALVLHNQSKTDRSQAVLKEVLETIQLDEGGDTAHVPIAAAKSWQSWNSEIETNAWLLRALVAID